MGSALMSYGTPTIRPLFQVLLYFEAVIMGR